jgi:hypothetical protein
VEKEFKKLNTPVYIDKSESSGGYLSLALRYSSGQDLRPSIYQVIKAKEWVILEFRQETKTLEDLFRELTKEN